MQYPRHHHHPHNPPPLPPPPPPPPPPPHHHHHNHHHHHHHHNHHYHHHHLHHHYFRAFTMMSSKHEEEKKTVNRNKNLLFSPASNSAWREPKCHVIICKTVSFPHPRQVLNSTLSNSPVNPLVPCVSTDVVHVSLSQLFHVTTNQSSELI